MDKVTITVDESFINELKKFAKLDSPHNDTNFCTYKYSGGSLDDAFDLGRIAGEVDMAQWVLSIIYEGTEE